MQLLQALKVSQRFKNGERFLKVGDGRVPVLALGVVELGLESCRVILSDCPSFMLYVIIVNGVIIMKGQLKNGVCTLLRLDSVMYTSGKTSSKDDVNNTHLWHCRLGHINKNRMNKLAQEGILELSNCESLPTCESCLLGKMTMSPFTGKGERVKEVLGLVHTDVCGPLNISAR